MSFDININVASAEAVIQRNEQALTAVSVAAADAGKKLADAGSSGDAAMRKVTAGAGSAVGDLGKLNQLIGVMTDETIAAGRAATGTGRSMSDWAEAMDREAKIVERIRAPMREYKADLDALDALLKKGTLTTAEYSEEMDRLIKKAGTMQGPKQMEPTAAAPAPAGATIGEYVGTLAAGGGLIALGHQLEGIVQNMHDIEDATTKAMNAAQKFADATHTTSSIVAEQVVLADQLHGSLHETMELYDKINDGTAGLALSHREQISLTRTLGEAVQLEGKSINEGASIMAKFSYAMASGTIESRALRQIMREVPTIADLWVKSFDTTRVGLVTLVKEGKVSIQDLVASMAQGGDSISAKFAANIHRTNEQATAEFKERWTLALGKDFSELVDEGMAKFNRSLPTLGNAVADSMAKVSSAIDDARAAADRADKAFVHWLFRPDGGIAKATQDAEALLSVIEDIGKTATRQAGLTSDPWGSNDENKTNLSAQLRTADAIRAPIHEARLELQNLAAVVKAGGINAEEARIKYDALQTVINDGRLPQAIKLWEEREGMTGALRDASDALGGLNSLLRSGKIAGDEYINWSDRLAGRYREAISLEDSYTSATLRRRAAQAGMIGDRSIGGIGVSLSTDQHLEQTPWDARRTAESTKGSAQLQSAFGALQLAQQERDALPASRELTKSLDEQFAAAEQLVAPQVAYEEALKRIGEAQKSGLVTQDGAVQLSRLAAESYRSQTEALEGSKAILQSIEGPQRAYVAGLKEAGDLLEHHRIDAEQYAQAVDKLRASYLAADDAGKTLAGGIEAQWLKAKQGADAFGATLAGTLAGDVDKLNESIVTAANGGTVAWDKMVDSMIQDLERLLVKQLEVMAITALLNALAPGSGTAAASTGTTGSVINALPAVTSKIGLGQNPGVYPASSPASARLGPASAAPVYNLTVVATIDDSVVHAAMNTPGGAQVIAAANRKVPGARAGR
jgi:tape measure domain-containing protein